MWAVWTKILWYCRILSKEISHDYISPESTLATERWQNMLDSYIYQERLIGVVVDEVHCVTEWGTSRNNKKRSAFCIWYSRLNELKSLVDVLTPSETGVLILTPPSTLLDSDS